MANYADRVRILGVTLSADRLSDDVDITNLTQQIAIYENINTAYLTGSITILDDHELYGILDMSGTERITFSFRAHKDFVDGSRIITKTFIITNIDMKKSNDNTSLMYCDIMEEHGYVDNLINFSKSYTDTGENILTKIAGDKLQKNITNNSLVPSAQPSFRYIVPYISPLQACSMIVKKMTTPNGLPYFLYSTLFSDDLVLTDLETAIAYTAFNESNPFTYSQADVASDDPVKQMFTLDTYESQGNEDTLMLAQLGAVGNTLNHINATTYQKFTERVDVPAIIRKLKDQGLVLFNQTIPVVDEQFQPQPDKNIKEYNSAIFNSLEMDTYRNTANYSQNLGIEQSKLKVIRHGVLNHLAKNVYSVTGPGMIFTSGNLNTTVGNQVKINVQKNTFPQSNNPSSYIDPKRSGYFLMTAKRYLFDVTDESMRYTMQCSRITSYAG